MVAAGTRPAPLSVSEAWDVLRQVPDPEVPVVSVVDLGIVRDVVVDGDTVIVTVTPTYSGCPAVKVIEQDIVSALLAHGAASAQVRTAWAPAWTTDWISDEGREKLRTYGIAPPGAAGRAVAGGDVLVPLLLRRAEPEAVSCPFCGAANSVLRSEFGSTACKALRWCEACRQPFEHFKPI